MELFRFYSAFSVFLMIAGVGLVFLIISLLFGEIFDFLDGGLDHDGDHGGPGLFSTRAIAVFILAFGSTGALATRAGFTVLPASLLGLGSGLVFGGLVVAFGRFLYGQQASSDVSHRDLVGQSARVVVTIPAGGVGQVRCRVGDELIDKIARAGDGDGIPENSVVRVEEVLGEIVIVRKP